MKVKLEDVCERGSSNLKQLDVIEKSGKYPIYGASGYIGNVDFFHQKNPYVAIVKDGAGVGRTMLLPAKSSVIGTMQYLIPKDNIMVEYLSYVVRYMHLEKYFTGATIPHIYFKDYKVEEFNLQPLDEQKKVVDILKNVENLIGMEQEKLCLLDTLIKSRFVEMFGDISTGESVYEIRKLEDVADIGSSHRVFTTEFVENGIPFYRGTEIGELANGIKPLNPYYISEEHYQRLVSDESKPKVGDLLLPSICNKGQVWMVDTEEPFYYKDGRVLYISPDKNLYNPIYLQMYMRAKTAFEYPKIGSGSTFAEFKIFMLKNFDIVTPPMGIQDQFAAFVQQVDKLKFEVQKSLNETQLLFDSLMQKYFG